MSTSTIDTWRGIKIWMKNLTKVPNEFFTPNLSTTYDTKQNRGTKFKNT
jgi:hypothetical protein